MGRLIKVTFQGPWAGYRTPQYQFYGGTSYLMPENEADFFRGFPGFVLEEIDPHGFTAGDRDLHPYAEPPGAVNYPPPHTLHNSGGNVDES
ncbi:MAG: hypothetical protein ACOX8W_08700 [bacterium]|jgi:hypothetical protein